MLVGLLLQLAAVLETLEMTVAILYFQPLLLQVVVGVDILHLSLLLAKLVALAVEVVEQVIAAAQAALELQTKVIRVGLERWPLTAQVVGAVLEQ